MWKYSQRCNNNQICNKGIVCFLIKWVKLTNNSVGPLRPSWLSLLTATAMPVPGLAAEGECSSIQPLKTDPKSLSPNTLSTRKFLVAAWSSVKAKLFKLDDCKISPALLELMSSSETLQHGLPTFSVSPCTHSELNPETKITSTTYYILLVYICN